MSLNSYALTSLDRLKAFLGIISSDYDTVLEYLINSVSDFVENECDRRFKKTAYSDVKLDGQSSKELILPQWPVISGETFTLYERKNSSDYGNNEWNTIDSDDYRVDNDSGIVKANFTFVRGFQNYKVDYTAGYDFNVSEETYLSDVGLSDLENIVWKLTGRVYNERKIPSNISRMKLYNYDVAFSKEAFNDDEIKEVLSKYQRFSF